MEKTENKSEEELKSEEIKKKKKVTLDDFEYLATVGKGAYGEVVLIQKKETKTQYAMKIIDKSFLFKVFP